MGDEGYPESPDPSPPASTGPRWVSVMQTWAIGPALRAGEVRAIPITAAGIRRQWSAATLRAAGRVPHVEGFIDLLAASALPARRVQTRGRGRAR